MWGVTNVTNVTPVAYMVMVIALPIDLLTYWTVMQICITYDTPPKTKVYIYFHLLPNNCFNVFSDTIYWQLTVAS